MRILIVCFALFTISVGNASPVFSQFVDLDGPIVSDFTEDFENGAAFFADADRNVATLEATGGIGDSAFVSAQTNELFQGVVLRAELDERAPGAASGGAFAGNYLASQVESVSLFLRHDHIDDASFGVRFATSANFPALNTTLGTLAPGDFQEFTIDFTDQNNFGVEGFDGLTFEAVAAQIGNIQITTTSETAGSYTVDLDNFSINVASVPEPSSLLLLASASGIGLLRRRRR